MGRRRREDAEERRTEWMNIRVTPSELASFGRRSQRAGCGASTLAREILFPKKPTHPGHEPEVWRNPQTVKLLRHLDALPEHNARVGNNLNQVAHHLSPGAEADRLMQGIEDVHREIEELGPLIRQAGYRAVSLNTTIDMTDLLHELDLLGERGAAVGSSLNRTAYQLNAGRDVDGAIEQIDDVLKPLAEFNALIRQVIERVIAL